LPTVCLAFSAFLCWSLHACLVKAATWLRLPTDFVRDSKQSFRFASRRLENASRSLVNSSLHVDTSQHRATLQRQASGRRKRSTVSCVLDQQDPSLSSQQQRSYRIRHPLARRAVHATTTSTTTADQSLVEHPDGQSWCVKVERRPTALAAILTRRCLL
jgi:hypothetical protein